MEKLLTVAVPSYNAEWCLNKCLSSFIAEQAVSDRLEVIVINDGSTDNTLKIAESYRERYPNIFRIIDKENAGHGSGINAAIKIATGKYFNAVDADDWVINLNAFLDILDETNADAIITHFHTVDMKSGERQEYKTRDIPLNKLYSLDEFTAWPGDIYPCTVFHGLTYRTEIYRSSNTVLSERIFYEDQEFSTFPFLKVETILPVDLFLNQYLVGNVNQSVSDANHVKRLEQVEQVVHRIFCCYDGYPDMSVGSRRYIARKCTDLLFNYYVVAMIKNPDKSAGRREAARFRQELLLMKPDLVKQVDKNYKMTSAMSRLGASGRMLDVMRHPLFYAVYRKLFKKNGGGK